MTDAAQGAEDQLAQSAVGAVSPVHAVLAGLRQPIVLILLLISFFTTISGKPLDGFLMLTVATLLVWDAARSRHPYPAGPGVSLGSEGGVLAPQGPSAVLRPGTAHSATAISAARPGGARRLLAGLGWVAAGVVYAWVAGTFRRYSWPVTISVVALGCLMVAVGWQGPLRRRAALARVALRRTWMWAVVLVTGGLWELSSLLQQPHLTTDSYAHPTISALTDPLLASHPGRSVALGGWLLIGWFLVGR